VKNSRAQSLLELSLFGVVILSLLSLVLLYGMGDNFRQTAEQRAFRKALAKAGGIGPTSYTLMHDRSIPNPQDMYGTGQPAPTGASATVLRDFQMLTKPDAGDKMPTLTIGFESGAGGTQELEFPTAKVDEYCWADDCNHRLVRDKYEMVFGANGMWNSTANCVKVFDNCAGEIFDYTGCKKQCRMMEDLTYCINQCGEQQLNRDASYCQEVCESEAPVFWYCENITKFVDFTGSSKWATGIQPRMTTASFRADSTDKSESPEGISTSDSISHTDTITRTIVYRPTGSSEPASRDKSNDVDRTSGVSMSEEW
jgi:hypothetical protein